MGQEDDIGRVPNEENQNRLNNTEKQQAPPAAPTMTDLSLPLAVDRQACVSLDEGSESRLKHARRHRKLAGGE
jgi:hypothetical protein